ncbi:hypothetical protein [Yinghuangia seranimata]|uniref:hypothetical protein n=1 Tax=Yinghuangia seranimata TaxID=408067 RepID=UPI00248A8F36|nr:hypothetical protein [Yinghuangia seranimata]MDI2127457.1 hypothetical protein [Yinghuangia seranimata]
MPAVSRRRVRAAALVAVVPLFAAAACGGDDDRAEPAPDALSDTQLASALLTQPELPAGWQLVGGGQKVGAGEVPQTDRKECQPVLDLVAGRSAKVAPTGQADAGLYLGSEADTGGSHLNLQQYRQGEADKLLDAAERALPSCGTFGVRQADGSLAPASAARTDPPGFGDRATAFTFTLTTDAGPMAIPYTVVRSSSVLLVASTVNEPAKNAPPLPTTIVRSQLDKLAGRQHR